jgi:geranylgeranyl diphosphate synthase type II
MKKIQEYTQLIEKTIAEQSFNEAPIELYQPISYILSLGGKRLRPALTLAAAELFGSSREKALQPCLGIEVFHNFSLIHDDIMDAAPLRRGKPTVHKKWDDNIAILSGDAMLVKAYQYIAQVDKEILPEVLATFSQTAIEVCEGQQYDLNFETLESVSEEDYINMIRLKTSVLLGCALKVGALIGGASKNDVDAIYNFGVNIGIAFQIQDDILDAFGEADKFGKLVGGDILNDKKTILMIQALKSSPELVNWIGEKENAEEKIETVKRIFEETGTKAYAEKQMHRYYEQALKNLDSVKGKKDVQDELKQFAEYLILRDV